MRKKDYFDYERGNQKFAKVCLDERMHKTVGQDKKIPLQIMWVAEGVKQIEHTDLSWVF